MNNQEDKREFFGKGKQEIRGIVWDWENFETTEGFPVSDNLLDWVVGQDRVIEEVKLALDEWLYKLKYLQKKKWYKPWLDPQAEKKPVSKILTPGPYLLLLGDPGTGKSLIGRAMAEYLTKLYAEHKIKRFDVLCWPNKLLPSNPKISVHPAGKGKVLLKQIAQKIAHRSLWKTWGIRILMFLLGALGLAFLGIALMDIMTFAPIIGLANALLRDAIVLSIGASIIFCAFFIWQFSRLLGGNLLSGIDIGGASRSDAPKLLVDNSSKTVPFIDATGHTSAQLFGSIAWDPYQTGGLGTPEHQRVVAGDVHRASMGILYIDEIKNLSPFDVVTLLSVMEDGCLPVTIRSQWHGADTAAMAVATEPIPALFFLLAAGNFDSIGQIHPALMDRLVGYGRVVRMNSDMPNTVENRRKYVQFIAQEIKRFHLPPFSREACIELVEEARRRSNKRDALTCRFRPLIAVIKTAGTLARNKGKEIVGVEEVKEAIDVHCKTIQRQILEHQVQEQGKLLEIKPVGIKRGTIYGLAVVTDQFSGEMTGSILRVKAQMVKKTSKKGVQGYYKVTGIAKDAKWINDSAEKVRSVILQKYGVDIAQEYFTHIDFSQAYGVDGPSAGVTMALLLCSLLEDKPIRQDVAVTGEINISAENEIEITAVGGVHEKIKAAEAWGFKKVVIPMKNLEQSIKESDYKIKVVGARTLDDYLKEVLADTDKE
jgi:Lon-like ATP-dependent protease